MINTALFMPASNARAIEKAKTLAADALILDLEDAVTVADKAIARKTIAGFLSDKEKRSAFGDRQVFVRLNAADTAFFEKDCETLADLIVDGIVLPKVESPLILDALPKRLTKSQIFVMIETPLGVLRAADVSADERVAGLIAGTNDLTAELRADPGSDRAELQFALQSIVAAARAYEKLALDGVFNAIDDEDGLTVEAEQGRRLGFDGKCLIHPKQIKVVKKVFLPSEAQLAEARALISAFEKAGAGVATYKGKMIEELHVKTARQTLSAL